MGRYKQRYDGEWHMPVMLEYKAACCDCGLVHNIDFKVISAKNHGRVIKNVRVLVRASRNNRSTAMLRRYMNKSNQKGEQ